jgi:hypothetical protein
MTGYGADNEFKSRKSSDKPEKSVKLTPLQTARGKALPDIENRLLKREATATAC